jgi:hypothetical protein
VIDLSARLMVEVDQRFAGAMNDSWAMEETKLLVSTRCSFGE